MSTSREPLSSGAEMQNWTQDQVENHLAERDALRARLLYAIRKCETFGDEGQGGIVPLLRPSDARRIADAETLHDLRDRKWVRLDDQGRCRVTPKGLEEGARMLAAERAKDEARSLATMQRARPHFLRRPDLMEDDLLNVNLGLIAALKAADAALYLDVATARDIIRNALREAGENV